MLDYSSLVDVRFTWVACELFTSKVCYTIRILKLYTLVNDQTSHFSLQERLSD